MLSSMSHTPTEVFAHSLKSRLKTLRATSPPSDSSSGGSPGSSDEELATAAAVARNMPISSLSADSLRKLLEASSRSMMGTTFPPAKWVHIQVKSNRYHSETDLNSLDNAEDLKKGLEKAEATGSNMEDKDSDLFFDFDISSPQSDADEDDATDIINDELKSDIILPDLEVVEMSCDSSSVNTPSTAFGSTSSGLYSDKDEESEDTSEIEKADCALDGLALDPEDWLKNPGASLSEMMLMKDKKAAEAALEATKKEGSIDDSTDSKDSDDTLDGSDRPLKSVGGMTTIMIGETEKQVASSKLSALISLLEKDRDSQPRSAIPSRSHVMSSASPAKEEEEVVKVIIYEEEVKKTEILGTSPANFSFLKGGVTIKKSSDSTESGPSMARSLKVKSDSKLMASPLALERSHSTSTLNEIKSAHSKMMNESPESLNKSFDKTSSGSSEGEAKEAGEDNKAKYRRCSSLKSGKTPPGTPARHKVVR